MLNFDNDKVKPFVIISVIVLLGIYFFYPEEEYHTQPIKVVQPKIEKKIEHIDFDESIVEEVQKTTIEPVKKIKIADKKEAQEEIKPKVQEIEQKQIVLVSTKDFSGRYTIKLISEIEIVVKNRNITRYVTMFGNIEEDSISNQFNMSLSQDYIEHIGDLKLQIEDITDEKRKLESDLYFLSNLNVDTSYEIKLDILDDTVTGYIVSSQEMPAFLRKELENDLPIVINIEEHNKGLTPPTN